MTSGMSNESDVRGQVNEVSIDRRQDRRIAAQVLNPKAIKGYAPFFDYEAHMLVRSLYYETEKGKKAIDPAHFVARYALKYVARASSSHGCGILTNVTCRLQ
jgi:cytochrome P450